MKTNKSSYSTLCTARAALSSLIFCDKTDNLTQHVLVRRFMKGAYNEFPPKPKYVFTWDISTVLDFFKRQNVKALDLKQTTHKLAALMAICSAQRCQTLSLLEIDNIHFRDSSVTIKVDQLLKQSRPGFTNPILAFQEFEDKRICVYSCLKDYIDITKELRKSKWLFISYVKPYKEVSSSTISRWIKCVLSEAGIDTDVFGAHSVRGASASAAFKANVNIEDILKAGGWSTAQTVAAFYNRPVADQQDCYNVKILQ